MIGHLAEYRLFPYERELALREMRALTGVEGELVEDRIITAGETAASRVIERATYLSAVTADEIRQPTVQALVEGNHWSARDGRPRSKQATRFGVHGIHEYRGKFNPQMARALVNVVNADASNLLDPFCGSGTTLLEGLRLGMTVAGVDRSPIAHFLATTKIRAAQNPYPRRLLSEFQRKAADVRDQLKIGQEIVQLIPTAWISDASAEYLEGWFTPPALSSLYAGLHLLNPPGQTTVDDLIFIAISSILRQVSLQLPEDLRVRRRPPGFVAPPLTEAFDVASARIEMALEELALMTTSRRGEASVVLGSCSSSKVVGALPSRPGPRLIVTSPPYATALPYIDTDRLSLVLLGLAQPSELRPAEAGLVGSREWNRSEATRWDAQRSSNLARLPDSVLQLTERIDEANRVTKAGFRRAAVPSLLYRYFAEMGDCFDAWKSYLRSGERAVLVVGRNRTGPKGQEIAIDTPALLGAVAETRGYELMERIPFETWPRYGLHSANGVNGEDAVLLTRRGGP